MRPFWGSSLEAYLLQPYCGLLFEETRYAHTLTSLAADESPEFLSAAGKTLHRAFISSSHYQIDLILPFKQPFSCNNNKSFIPCSCVEINFRVHNTILRALFWKIWLPSFSEKVMSSDKRSSQNPLKQWRSPKIQSRFGFSMSEKLLHLFLINLLSHRGIVDRESLKVHSRVGLLTCVHNRMNYPIFDGKLWHCKTPVLWLWIIWHCLMWIVAKYWWAVGACGKYQSCQSCQRAHGKLRSKTRALQKCGIYIIFQL